MSLSNPFRRAAAHPTLRERAAALRANLSPAAAVHAAPATTTMPEPGSAEAMTAFHAACHEHTVRTQFANEYADLKRTSLEWWTTDSLSKAMESGEIMPTECARLYPLATDRELRMRQIEHELNLGALHALAFAECYPHPQDEAGKAEAPPSNLADACLWASRRRDWIDDARNRPALSDDATEGELKKVDAIVARAIEEPSASIRDLAAKAALALEDYTRFTVDLIKRPDDGVRIVQTVLREVAALSDKESSADFYGKDDLTSAILDGWKAWGAIPSEPDEVWNRADKQRDQLLYAAMALPATPETIPAKALACAWMEWVDTERPGQPREDYGPSDQLVFDIHAAIMKGAPSTGARRPDQSYSYLVDRIDFGSATMSELLTIRSVADCVGSVAYAHSWASRCHRGKTAWGNPDYNAAGKLMASIGDALTAVESAAEREAQRRNPSDFAERETRLYMLAPAAIDNGAPDEIEAFARELLAHAEAERARN